MAVAPADQLYAKLAAEMPSMLEVNGRRFHAATPDELRAHGVDPESGAWVYLGEEHYVSAWFQPEDLRRNEAPAQFRDLCQAKAHQARMTLQGILDHG